MADAPGTQILTVSGFTNTPGGLSDAGLLFASGGHPRFPQQNNNTHMVVLWIIIGLVVGAGVAVWLTTGVLRNKLLAQSQQVLKDAEEKGEVIKKEKML